MQAVGPRIEGALAGWLFISIDDDGDDTGEAIKDVGDVLTTIYLISSADKRVREVVGPAVTF